LHFSFTVSILGYLLILNYAVMGIVFVLIIFVIIAAVFLKFKSSTGSSSLLGNNVPVSNVLSHWSHFFHFLELSSNMFYEQLEKTLKEHEMPNAKIERTTHKEAGLLSANREYLRIKHGDIVFDVCASPFGKDFFISWWLYETAGTMRTLFKHTKVGNFLNARAENRTFYQIDEESMFRSCVHDCILETITKVTEGKTAYQLTDAQKEFKMGGL
jgi:hypothetical protein